mgnify:CR=1 FL=1
MENYFYNIEIGKRTKAGNLNVQHYFVCRTDNQNQNDVRSFFYKKYVGFDINCTKIETIETVEIKQTPAPATDYYIGLTKEEEKLHKRIKELEGKTKLIDSYEKEISIDSFSEEEIIIYRQIKRLEKIIAKKEKYLIAILSNRLKCVYKPFCKSVSFPDCVKIGFQNRKYVVHLIGKINELFK